MKSWLHKANLWGKPVVVYSFGELGGRMAALLAKEWGLGYRPIAVLGSRPDRGEDRYDASPDEKSLAEATRLSRTTGVDTMIFAMPHTRREDLAKLVHWASFGFRHVTVIPNLDGIANSGVVAGTSGASSG